jgi:four helix bundle protein
MITNLEDFKVYNQAMTLSDEVWSIVANWPNFEKHTIGRQLVRAIDSIAANLSEGLGRYHFGEARQFSYYSRGSLYETKTWLSKAYARNLISEDQHQKLDTDLTRIAKMLNAYINAIGPQTTKKSSS